MAQKRHTVFTACADAVQDHDPYLGAIFTSMAYGIYPIPVLSDNGNDVIWFRRTGSTSTDKDKTQRLQTAATELMNIPIIKEYNELHPEKPLHVNASKMAVSWNVDTSVPIGIHVKAIVALLEWTQWDGMDGPKGPWAELHRNVHNTKCNEKAISRTVRSAQFVEFVGNRAHDQGLSDTACLVVIEEALQQLQAGEVKIQYNDVGRIVDVL